MLESMYTRFNETFDELSSLETVINLTKQYCLEKEANYIYYGLIQDDKFKLSSERNQYINMLSIALEKIEQLNKINNKFEKDLTTYSSTPTMAADK